MVAANEAIRREQRARPDDARIARRDVERPNVLVLRLVDLVVRVRDVESRPGRLNIQMDRVGSARPKVEAVEEGQLIAGVMRGSQPGVSGAGPHFARTGAVRVHRGSAKRIRRIKWRDHTPREFVVLVIRGVAMILVLISWLIAHPDRGHHHPAAVNINSR